MHTYIGIYVLEALGRICTDHSDHFDHFDSVHSWEHHTKRVEELFPFFFYFCELGYGLYSPLSNLSSGEKLFLGCAAKREVLDETGEIGKEVQLSQV